MLVVRSSLLAKWLREWVRVRVSVRVGARESNTSFIFSLVLQNVVNIFGFGASYEYLIRQHKPFQTGAASLVRPQEVKGTLLFMIDKLMSGSSFVGKAFIKPQNSEL